MNTILLQKEFPQIGVVRFVGSKRARRLSISLRPGAGVRVVVPGNVALAEAVSFVIRKTFWVRKHLPRLAAMESLHAQLARQTCSIDREEARRTLKKRVAELADHHGFRYKKVSVRNQKTRWGSCSATDNLSLNQKLLLLPEELMDLVIIHELVHTRVKNHGPKFHAELVRCLPDAAELDRRLEDYCLRLM